MKRRAPSFIEKKPYDQKRQAFGCTTELMMRSQRRYWGGEIFRPIAQFPCWQVLKPTPVEIEAFRVFLERLIEVESYIKSECKAQRAVLNDRVKQGGITDYEIDITIDFYLKDGDPACIEDDDNMLAVITTVSDRMLDDKQNWWNYGLKDREYPLNGHRHPYLFHHLFDHMGITHPDLLRIGDIWIDINVVVQRNFIYPADKT